MRYLIFIAGIVAVLASAHLGHAEEEEKKNRFVCRPEVYKRLVKAQKLLQENKYVEAEAAAKLVQRRSRLNDHENALVMQTLGYIYAGQEKLVLAAQTLEKTYDLHALPAATQVSMLFNIGQIYMAAKKFRPAVKTFDVWLTKAINPKEQALYTVAAANYQIKAYKATIRHGERALKTTRKPKDSLLQLLLSSYVELKQYKSAIRILKLLVGRHPDKRNNWLQLAALYSQTGDEKRALAVMELAKSMGVLKKSDEIVQLSQRLLAEEIPFEAAKLLENSVKEGAVKMNAETAKLVATAWLQSRNLEKAAPALRSAAELAKDGELYVRLAQLELERERWKQAISASEKALKKGGIDNRGQVHLLIGIAQVRSGDEGRARQAFERASKERSSRKSALGWIKFLAASKKTAEARN